MEENRNLNSITNANSSPVSNRTIQTNILSNTSSSPSTTPTNQLNVKNQQSPQHHGSTSHVEGIDMKSLTSNTVPVQIQSQSPLLQSTEIKSEERTNVIVKFLPLTLNSEQLYTLFLPYGNIKSYKLVKNHETGQSQGYGFIKYESEISAAKAVSALNGTVIDHKTIRVAIANPTLTNQHQQQQNLHNHTESIKSNIYIAGLPKSYSKADLDALFCQYGTIVESRILLDTNGEARGIGFVRFETTASAIAAINGANNVTPIGGVQPMVVKFARDTNTSHYNQYNPYNQYTPYVNRNNTNFRRNIPITGMDFHNGYSSYGPVASTISHSTIPHGTLQHSTMSHGIMQHNTMQHSTMPQQLRRDQQITYSYMNPSFRESYYRPPYSFYYTSGPPNLQVYDPQTPTTQHQQLAPIPSQPQSQLQPLSTFQPSYERDGVCLFVFHIPPEIKDDDLHRLFSHCGTVLSCKIIVDAATQQSKGFGFVNMSNQTEADNAIHSLNGFRIGNKYLKVSLKTKKVT